MITKINQTAPIVDNEGKPIGQFVYFLNEVFSLGIVTGSGSPEGVIEATQTQLYMDTAGTAGDILYIKRDADIGGDRSLGWILV